MNLKFLFISILIVFNSSLSFCRSEDAVDETVIKKIDLKSDNLDPLNLDQKSSEKLNVSDPSLKNISGKLSKQESEINIKKVDERDTKNDDKETKDLLTSKLLATKDEQITGSNGNKNIKHKSDTKQDDNKQDDNQEIQLVLEKSTDKADDLPSFDEWKKKVVEEDQPSNQHPSSTTSNSNNKKLFPNSMKGNKLRVRNYASSECGAKVINSNKEAQGSYKILSESQDEYMLNPCNAKIWFIIELCEAIKLSSIEVANYELFSSTFRDFLIYGSGHYPTRDWQLVGNFTANDIKQVQVFSFVGESEFRKFIKIEIQSHHGTEHFCPFSLVRMFGTSMTDEFDALDGESEKMMQIDEIEILETNKLNENRTEKSNFNEKSVFYKMLVKVAEFFYKNLPERDRKDTKEENFAKFLKDQDTMDAIVEQSVMTLMPKLELKLNKCLNLEKLKPKKRYKRMKFCNYLRTLISPTTFDLLMKEIVKDNNLQFKCLCNPNSNESLDKTTKLNTTIGDDNDNKLNKSRLESSILDQKYDDFKIDDKQKKIDLKNDQYLSLTDSIKITSSLNSQTLLLPTPVMIKDEQKSSIENLNSLNEKIDDQTKSLDRSVELEDKKQTNEINDNSKLIKSSKVMNDKLMTTDLNGNSATLDLNQQQQQMKSTEKISSDQQPIASSKPIHSSADDEFPPNGTPISGSSSKETIFIRMINKIKTLELNLSLSSQYLEELSQRYRRQMDEMQKNFNQTIFKLNETSKIALEKDNRQQLLLDKLGSKITLLEDKLYFLIAIIIAKVIFDLISFWYRR